MKNIIIVILVILLGGLIGFFGVLVSVFADSSLTEQLITIGVILLIYGVLGGLYSLLLPKYSWQWGLLLSFPGILLLGLYMLSEFNPYYFIYMILILSFSCFSAYSVNSFRKRKKK